MYPWISLADPRPAKNMEDQLVLLIFMVLVNVKTFSGTIDGEDLSFSDLAW